MLLAQISLAIIKQNTATPEEEYSTLYEFCLHVIGQLYTLSKIIWRVQYRRLNTHLDVLN